VARTDARQKASEVPIRVVGLPQPKGAGGLWPTTESQKQLRCATPFDEAEAVTVKNRDTKRRVSSANCAARRDGTASE
jgi:hypothetical protein